MPLLNNIVWGILLSMIFTYSFNGVFSVYQRPKNHAATCDWSAYIEDNYFKSYKYSNNLNWFDGSISVLFTQMQAQHVIIWVLVISSK